MVQPINFQSKVSSIFHLTGAVLEEYLVPSLPVTNITMSPITDGAVGLTEVNSLGIGIETGQSIELLSDPMLGQMPNPQMIAAPQMATAATVDQEQARVQKSPIVPLRVRVLIMLQLYSSSLSQCFVTTYEGLLGQ